MTVTESATESAIGTETGTGIENEIERRITIVNDEEIMAITTAIGIRTEKIEKESGPDGIAKENESEIENLKHGESSQPRKMNHNEWFIPTCLFRQLCRYLDKVAPA